jgi:hypothetical protein
MAVKEFSGPQLVIRLPDQDTLSDAANKYLNEQRNHLMRILFAILLILPTHVFAASNTDIVNQIVASFSAECSALQDDAQNGETFYELVPVIVSDESIYEIQITSNGKMATVLFSDFSCPGVGASSWCGSSGCEVFIIVDGVSYETRGWKPFTVAHGEEVLVMLPRSGGACGIENGAPCYTVTIWNENDKEFNKISN